MKRFSIWLVSALAGPGLAAAQQVAESPVSFSAVQPGRWYVGLSLGVPVYWREQVYQLSPLQTDAYRAIAVPTLWVGRQFTAHWAGQVGLNGYVVPKATAAGQYTYPTTYTPFTVVVDSYVNFGATVVALPLLVRYNPRWRLGFDTSLEGWLGLASVWQQVQYDGEERQNGQVTYDQHQHGQLFDLYPSAGLSLGLGVWQGTEVLFDAGLAGRSRLAGRNLSSPTWSPLGSLTLRCQLGGRAHRMRYRAAY